MAKYRDAFIDLKLNRNLIDPNFEGYKLSLDSLPTYRLTFDTDVDDPKLITESQYSIQHVKEFSSTNHLVIDPWNTNSLYYVSSDWNIMNIQTHNVFNLSAPQSVFEIPNASENQHKTGRHNVSLKFLSADWLIVADGAGTLHLIWTGNRSDGLDWQIHFSSSELVNGSPFILKHSVMHLDSESQRVECLILHVDEDEIQKTDSSQFTTIIEWITLVSVDSMKTWSVERTRKIESKSAAEYASIQNKGEGIFLAGEKSFKLTYDSVKPVEEPKEEEKPKSDKEVYSWCQTDEAVTVNFQFAETITKDDISCKFQTKHINLEIKEGGVLLNGELYGNIDLEGSTWTFSNKSLDIFLTKQSPGVWLNIVPGDDRGKMIADEAQLQEMSECLANLTGNGTEGEEDNELYNTQELEECDVNTADSAMMVRIDGESHQVTHRVPLSSHQILFTVDLGLATPPAICLRHDVDGILWQPSPGVEDDKIPWDHVGTFNALGYVKASKRDNKYALCAPDQSYAVLSDCIRHVYIYRQCAPTMTPVRNRKTGKQVGSIAKQQVVTLDSLDTVIGLQATRDKLYVMTSKMLYIIKVCSTDTDD